MEYITKQQEEILVGMILEAIQEEKYEYAVDLFIVLNDSLDIDRKPTYSLEKICWMHTLDYISKISKKEEKCVYILEFDANFIKIGISKQVKRRMRTLETQSGKKIKRFTYTKPTEKASDLEKELHKRFKDKRLQGEYFSCSYEKAKSVLESIEGIEIDLGVSV